MEICFRVLAPVDEAPTGNILGCSELRGRDQGTVRVVLSAPTEVKCPKPCLAPIASLTGEDIDGSPCPSTRSSRPWLRTDPSYDRLCLLIPNDEMEDALRCSPPARADNPLIHDVLFIDRTSNRPSEEETYEEPIMRIDGFPCLDSS